jgi:hypothetical protein
MAGHRRRSDLRRLFVAQQHEAGFRVHSSGTAQRVESAALLNEGVERAMEAA